jgi:hypothetical protein
VLEKFVQDFSGIGSGSGSGSGSSQLEESDPDPEKNRPDAQHCYIGIRGVILNIRLGLYVHICRYREIDR